MRSALLRKLVIVALLVGTPIAGPGVGTVHAQTAPPTGSGLRGDYYNNKDFTAFVLTRIDPTVAFDWMLGSPDPAIGPDTFSVRWTGGVMADTNETYTFYTYASDGVRLWVNNQLLIDDFVIHGNPIERSATIALTAGAYYEIRLDYFEQQTDALVTLSWQTPTISKRVIPQSHLFATGPGDAARLLEQATFGPTENDIYHVMSIGTDAWLDEQFNATPTGYPDMPYYPSTAPPNCVYVGSDPSGASSICNRDNYSLFQVQLRFLQNAMTGNDQLRQRVAFALSQILVVSGTEINQGYGMTEYQQILFDRAFGNYRDILYDVTLNPAMGRYLDMVNNDKPNIPAHIVPNENYARELLQLFSIGTNKLNLDGSVQRDASNEPIPAYSQDAIEGFAHVFTGWTYPTLDGGTPVRHNPTNYIGPMYAFPTNHDTGTKALLDGAILPARDDAYADLNAAIDNIFNHPNVAPFISKQLIQKLVTSNPSPAYVSRVATVFNNDGNGVRGNLRAVVRAILTDVEARTLPPPAAAGHLKEPVLLVIGALRALHGQSDGVYLRGQISSMSQNLFYSPSVFNYYPPDTPLPNTTYLGPEFAIMNSSTALNRINFMNTIVYTMLIAPDPTVLNATGTSLDLSFLQPLASDPSKMVDKLSFVMLHGALSASAKSAIVTAVNAVSSSDTLGRARCAAYLVASSSQYQVQR